MSEAPAATTPCRACGEAIAASARICRVCKSPQGWTRYLFQWKEIAVAVLALVPLWSATGSLAKLASPEPKRPDIRASVLACDSQSFGLALTNLGNVAGLVGSMQLVLRSGGRDVGSALDLLPQDGPSTLILEPGGIQAVTLVPRIAGVPTEVPFPQDSADCSAVARVSIKSFAGADATVEAVCPCP